MKLDMFLLKEWISIHRKIGRFPNIFEFFLVRDAYKESGRHYHTWEHIGNTIKFVNENYSHPKIHLVKFALFYHDIVYDVGETDNEATSAFMWAYYAYKLPRDGFMTNAEVDDVANMIKDTASHKLTENASILSKMMMDSDMSIFLSDPDTYLQYARNIWLEYSSVGKEVYAENRLKFLRSLDAYEIFYTDEANKNCWIVDENIAYEIDLLTNRPEDLFDGNI